jgi:Fe-S-cluster containining protein
MAGKRLGVFRRLEALYARMQKEYDKAALPAGFSCEGCPQNCCVSYFRHHTYIEWAYLWKGLAAMPEEEREEIEARAGDYVAHARERLAGGKKPDMLCPLNKGGLCQAYEHRLMICRLHGVPHTLLTRQGPREYPGCFRFAEFAGDQAPVLLDRTPLYRELAALEMDFLGKKAGSLPKVDLTTAEMIVMGRPGVFL